MSTEGAILTMLVAILGGNALFEYFRTLSVWQLAVALIASAGFIGIGSALAWHFFSKAAKDRKRRIEQILEIPKTLITPGASVYLGVDQDLSVPVFLPDAIRSRHVHILGATGSGKTESVILNFLRQDVARGLGSIILDAKGDASFLDELTRWVPSERLQVFDLSSDESMPYDPLLAGSPLESAQRLFSSLRWSEEYYRSKAFSALQRLFELHHQKFERNPTLAELHQYLETEEM